MAEKTYPRFTLSQRIQHILLTVTFFGLVFTGLPQKYSTESWAQTVINIFGGIEAVRIIHRVMATGLMATAIYHGGEVSYKLFVLGQRPTMLPSLRDLRDAWQWVRYNLGLDNLHPRMPRYNFGEKAEYLALIWGTVIMILTGVMLWNPIALTKLFPGTWIPAARFAHGAEALLAVFSIVIWHLYNTVIKTRNPSIFTGRIPRSLMEEEHAEELEAIEQGQTERPIPASVLAQRKRFFWPYAAVMTIILVGGLIYFVSFEDTAISTVPRLASAGGVSVSVDPAAVGNSERGAALWPTMECQTCHGAQAEAVPGMSQIPLAGTQISFEAFVASVRRGPADMPAFSEEEISDTQLADLWLWLQTLAPHP
jgi:cytochrome b subunit of formate dehydrogenase